jgi:hypothetical protein
MADSTRPIVLTAPEAGARVELHVDPAAVLQVEFDINSALATRAGNDLVFSFENGGKLILVDFIDIIATGKAPEGIFPLKLPQEPLRAAVVLPIFMNRANCSGASIRFSRRMAAAPA